MAIMQRAADKNYEIKEEIGEEYNMQLICVFLKSKNKHLELDAKLSHVHMTYLIVL